MGMNQKWKTECYEYSSNLSGFFLSPLLNTKMSSAYKTWNENWVPLVLGLVWISWVMLRLETSSAKHKSKGKRWWKSKKWMCYVMVNN